MKRALLSLFGAGMLFATLAHASAEPTPQPTRDEGASSVAVCIAPEQAPVQEEALAPACAPVPCTTCEDRLDTCEASCTTRQCYTDCQTKFRNCRTCCY
jgi:hypothetical protein